MASGRLLSLSVELNPRRTSDGPCRHDVLFYGLGNVGDSNLFPLEPREEVTWKEEFAVNDD